jgi:hypothetical protein
MVSFHFSNFTEKVIMTLSAKEEEVQFVSIPLRISNGQSTIFPQKKV